MIYSLELYFQVLDAKPSPNHKAYSHSHHNISLEGPQCIYSRQFKNVGPICGLLGIKESHLISESSQGKNNNPHKRETDHIKLPLYFKKISLNLMVWICWAILALHLRYGMDIPPHEALICLFMIRSKSLCQKISNSLSSHALFFIVLLFNLVWHLPYSFLCFVLNSLSCIYRSSWTTTTSCITLTNIPYFVCIATHIPILGWY